MSVVAEESVSIGVDIGGTCTDCVVVDEQGGVQVAKVFSTPDDFSRGILDAVAAVAAQQETSVEHLLGRTRLFFHSTTVAENAIIGESLAPSAMITTRGHRDTLFATRGGYGRWSGLRQDERRDPTGTAKPPPLIPTTLTQTVRERIDADGEVMIPLDDEDVERAVNALLAKRIQAIGVCLLWSFANPAHELLVRNVIERLAPNVFVTLSHEVAPASGEYERTSTVALNAALGPVVGEYLQRLADQLHTTGFEGTLLVMQAYGGLLPVSRVNARPVGLVESGPVSGLMACKRLGELIGVRSLISADLGGTTFKVGVVRDGLVEYQRESLVSRYHLSLPKLDVESLGIAGGSVISVDSRTGVPHVGPRSAGSYPGPVSYGHGGTEPTVTDVDVVLGFMNARFFLGGHATLNPGAARDVFEERVASQLRLEVLPAAAAIYRLVNSHILDLLHRMTIQRGLDPRTFALFSVGGTAGMHLPAVAARLGIPTVVVPYTASVQGAFGLVTSDVIHEEVRPRVLEAPNDPEVVQQIFDELSRRVLGQLQSEGFGADDIRIARSIDMRYRRQVHVVTAPVLSPEKMSEKSLSDAIDLFESLYRQRYGAESTYREAGIEFVTFRVRGSGRVQGTDPRTWSDDRKGLANSIVDEVEVYMPTEDEAKLVPGYSFDRIPVGSVIEGPGLIWSPITTIVLERRERARLDHFRNLVISTGVPERAS
jgi:N-methylhydantoinase A